MNEMLNYNTFLTTLIVYLCFNSSPPNLEQVAVCLYDDVDDDHQMAHTHTHSDVTHRAGLC